MIILGVTLFKNKKLVVLKNKKIDLIKYDNYYNIGFKYIDNIKQKKNDIYKILDDNKKRMTEIKYSPIGKYLIKIDRIDYFKNNTLKFQAPKHYKFASYDYFLYNNMDSFNKMNINKINNNIIYAVIKSANEEKNYKILSLLLLKSRGK